MYLLLAELSKCCCLFLLSSATVMRWCITDKGSKHNAVLQAATPLAAVMQWFIKDFSGHVAGVLFAGYQVCHGRLQMHSWHLS